MMKSPNVKFSVLLIVAFLLSSCGSAPTRIGEGVRGAIDRAEDKRDSDSEKIIYLPKKTEN